MEGRKDILEHQTGRQAGTLQPLPHFTLKSPVLYCFLIYSETNFFSHFKISEIRMLLTVNVTLQSPDHVFPPPEIMHITTVHLILSGVLNLIK